MNPLKPLMDEILELSDRKQRDYGSTGDPFQNVRASEQLGIPAWKGAVVRMGDKWKRIQKFTREGDLANESFEDSLQDMAVYSLIALALYRNARDEAEQERPMSNEEYRAYLYDRAYSEHESI